MKKVVALLIAAALLAGSAVPVAADGRGYRHHGYKHGYGYYGGHHKHTRHHYGYRHHRHYRHDRHGHHNHGAVIVGALAGGIVLGHLLSRPAYVAPAPVAAQPAFRNCVATTGTGSWYGRPALFGGTMCYDAGGTSYILNDSVRFLHYL